MREKILTGLTVLVLFLLASGTECRAEIAGDDAFTDLAWQQVYEEELQGGVVQSVCATKDYIICIENMADNPQVPDVVSAYYRNDRDENGNPVEPYTLAKRTADREWEHGNGMAYNPDTGEIYVALYTNTIPENRGSLYVMDADTLAYKRTIKVSDDYNILGIDYVREKNQYVIQTNVDGGYSFKILDAGFKVIEDLGEYAYTAEGDNFQDLAVCGDYIINFPLTLGLGIGDFIHVYSISERKMVSAPQLDYGFQGIVGDEPESLCELEPGVFLSAVNVVEESGARKIRFYKAEVPYYFTVNVEAENGQAAASEQKVLRGENYSLEFTPGKGYEFAGLTINGEEISQEGSLGYTIENIQSDQNIQVAFTKIPFPIRKVGITAAAAAVLTGLVILFYSYLLHVRRERKRKERARRRRRIMPEVHQTA